MREKYSNNSKKILSPAFLKVKSMNMQILGDFFYKRGIHADVPDLKINSKLT